MYHFLLQEKFKTILRRFRGKQCTSANNRLKLVILVTFAAMYKQINIFDYQSFRKKKKAHVYCESSFSLSQQSSTNTFTCQGNSIGCLQKTRLKMKNPQKYKILFLSIYYAIIQSRELSDIFSLCVLDSHVVYDQVEV